MAGEFRACAVVVRRGDRVGLRGQWFEVRGTRMDRFATGGAVVVLTFETRGPLRVPVFLRLPVSRMSSAPLQVAPSAIVQEREWALLADVSGSPPIFEVECTTCHAGCEASNEPDAAERTRWCVRHAWETGHTGYRDIRTGFLRAAHSQSAGGAADADA